MQFQTASGRSGHRKKTEGAKETCCNFNFMKKNSEDDQSKIYETYIYRYIYKKDN